MSDAAGSGAQRERQDAALATATVFPLSANRA